MGVGPGINRRDPVDLDVNQTHNRLKKIDSGLKAFRVTKLEIFFMNRTTWDTLIVVKVP